MRQAVTNQQVSSVELVVDFDSSVQSLSALEGAAYRLIGTATCQIERVADRFVCHLTAWNNSGQSQKIDVESLKVQFLNFVVDENLRARIAEKTDGVRNVILALAFGSLAAAQKEPD